MPHRQTADDIAPHVERKVDTLLKTGVEKSEIRGITLKLLVGIIVHTVIVVATACSIYFALKGDIRDLNTLRSEEAKYWDLKFQQLQLQNSAFQKQLDQIQYRIDNLILPDKK